MITSSIKMFVRQIARDKVIILSFCFVFTYFIFGCATSFASRDIINLVYKSQYTQFISILLLLFVGMKIGRAEANSHSDELFSSMSGVKKPHLIGKYIVGIAIALSWFALYLITMMVFWLISKSTFAVFLHITSYSVLRVAIPYLVAMLVAIAIGEQFSKRASFVAILIIWCFISPFSTFVAKYVFSSLHIDSLFAQYFVDVLNLGGKIILAPASPYGLNQGLPIWISNGLILLFVCLYCLTTAILSSKLFNKIVIAISFCTVIVCALAMSSSEKTQTYFDAFSSYSVYRGISDSRYYNELYVNNSAHMGKVLDNQKLPDFSGDIAAEVVQYDITFLPKAVDTTVECLITTIGQKTFSKQTFTLFHNFIIEEVTIDGQAVDFEQSGDYFEVTFPRTVAADIQSEIYVKYSGLSSASFPANSEVVCLPATFPWLPQIGMTLPQEKSMFNNGFESIMFEPWRSQSKIRFNLHYAANNTTYTNLTEVSKGVWQGTSDSGLSVVSADLLTKSSVDGYTVYYPEPLWQYLPDLIKSTKDIVDARQELLDLTGITKSQKFSKTIVVYPYAPSDPNNADTLYKVNDDIVLHFSATTNAFNYLYRIDMPPRELAFFSAFSSLTYTLAFQQSLDTEPLSASIRDNWFNWCSAALFSKELVVNFDAKDFYAQYYEDTGNLFNTTEEQLIAFEKKFKELLTHNDTALPRSFFAWWFTRCNEGNPPQIDEYLTEVERLLKGGI